MEDNTIDAWITSMLRHEHSGKKEKAEKRIGGGVGGETSYNRNEDEEADPCAQNGKTIVHSPSHRTVSGFCFSF